MPTRVYQSTAKPMVAASGQLRYVWNAWTPSNDRCQRECGVKAASQLCVRRVSLVGRASVITGTALHTRGGAGDGQPFSLSTAGTSKLNLAVPAQRHRDKNVTAPVANPSWALKVQRVRRKIKALNALMIEPGADVAALQVGVVACEAEIAKLRRDRIEEILASPMPKAAGIYGRVLRA